MSLYDKRCQRSDLAEKLTFLTISDRDAVLDALDEINERFEVSRIPLNYCPECGRQIRKMKRST